MPIVRETFKQITKISAQARIESTAEINDICAPFTPCLLIYSKPKYPAFLTGRTVCISVIIEGATAIDYCIIDIIVQNEM
jgi:hypothetical protein